MTEPRCGLVAEGLEQLEPGPARRQHSSLGHRLVELARGGGVVRDPAADAELGQPGLPVMDHRADGHVEVRPRLAAPGWREVADRAAVRAAGSVLEPGDEPHRGDLGGPGHRAAGEERAELFRKGHAGAKRGPNGRSQLPHGLVTLRLEQPIRPHRARHGDAAEVAPQQVDNHGVLRPVLGGRRQPSRVLLVLLRPPASWGRALHRTRGDPLPVDPEEQLRGRRQHAERAPRQVGRVAAALRHAEVAVQVGFVPVELGAQPERVVHLVRVAGRDPLADRGHRCVVPGPVDRGRPRNVIGGWAVVGDGLERWDVLAPLEDGEPQERERGEGVAAIPPPDRQRRV